MNRSESDNRRESFFVVDSFLLGVAFSNQMCFIPIKYLFDFSFNFQNPCITNSFLTFWKINKRLNFVDSHLLHFFLHYLFLQFTSRTWRVLVEPYWFIIVWFHHILLLMKHESFIVNVELMLRNRNTLAMMHLSNFRNLNIFFTPTRMKFFYNWLNCASANIIHFE